jgi:hypothetical protein
MSRASMDESIERCRKCDQTSPWPLSHYCKRGEVTRNMFDEYALRREIEKHWGMHGAHAQVYRTLLAKIEERNGPSEALKVAVGNAENKLRNLGRTFSGPNFTDRYGDGPHCLALADALRTAMRSATRERSEEKK